MSDKIILRISYYAGLVMLILGGYFLGGLPLSIMAFGWILMSDAYFDREAEKGD